MPPAAPEEREWTPCGAVGWLDGDAGLSTVTTEHSARAAEAWAARTVVRRGGHSMSQQTGLAKGPGQILTARSRLRLPSGGGPRPAGGPTLGDRHRERNLRPTAAVRYLGRHCGRRFSTVRCAVVLRGVLAWVAVLVLLAGCSGESGATSHAPAPAVSSTSQPKVSSSARPVAAPAPMQTVQVQIRRTRMPAVALNAVAFANDKVGWAAGNGIILGLPLPTSGVLSNGVESCR